MAGHEIKHPLGIEVEAIQSAIVAGLGDRQDLLGGNLEVVFVADETSGLGLDVAVIVDWETKNRTTIKTPSQDKDVDGVWSFELNGQTNPIFHRFTVDDIMRKCFPINRTGGDGHSFASSYLQFDISEHGVVFTAGDGQDIESQYYAYGTDMYETITKKARMLASLGKLAVLAEEVWKF